MSQERTERREWAKDREIIEASMPGPWRRQKCLVAGRGSFAGQVIADCGGGFKPIDESNAIYVTESRIAWPAALDEIDRLNAVIADMEAEDEEKEAAISDYRRGEYDAGAKQAASELIIDDLTTKVQEQDEKISDLERSVDDREWVINERDKKIAYQRSKLAELDEADAWAEYWRREAFRNHPTQEAYDAACAALEKHRKRADAGDKEIERLSWSNGEQLKQIDILEINLNSRDEQIIQQRGEVKRLQALMVLIKLDLEYGRVEAALLSAKQSLKGVE